MSKALQWVIGISAVLIVALVIFSTVWSFFAPRPAGNSGDGYGMMSGWGFGPFGWIGMIFMWLIPVGFIVLTVLGVLWLVRAVGGGAANLSAPARACPSCGHAVQSDWKACPHCGATLV